MKRIGKESKGITLIALVVTIIILLILAGVTIYFVTNNGLIGKVEEARDKSNEAEQKELETLDQAKAEIEKYLKGNSEVSIPEESLIQIEYEFDASTGSITGIKNKESYYEGGWDPASHSGIGDCILPGGDVLVIPSQIDGVKVKNVGNSKDIYTAPAIFATCSNIKTVIIPDGVTELGACCWNQCPNVTTVTIPASVTSIGGYCFGNCPNLTTINYTGTMEEWNAITKENHNDPLSTANIVYNYGK